MAAFEHHVFEKMGDAGNSGAFIDRTDFGDPATSHIGVALLLNEQELHAVFEYVDLWFDPLRGGDVQRQTSGHEQSRRNTDQEAERLSVNSHRIFWYKNL